MTKKNVESTFTPITATMWDDFYGQESHVEVEFYLNRFKDAPLTGRTLDIGCGTGRFMIPLLKKGYQCVGIDASEPMLEVAAQKAEEAGLRANLRKVTFEGYEDSDTFQGITAFYVVFYLLKTEELLTFFKKAHALLSPGGVLLFNYYNPFELWQPKQWTYTTSYPFEGGFGRVEYTYKPTDHLRGIADMQDYSMVSKNGESRFEYTIRQVRFYTMTELEMLVREAGFTDVHTHADLAATPVMKEDSRGYTLYTVARKS